MSRRPGGTRFAPGDNAMTTNPHPSDPERTLGSIVRGLTEDLSMLFRSEIALAKLELKETVSKLGGGIGLLSAALFCLLFGLAFLLVMLILVLALWMPAWAAASPSCWSC
jgi:uncharacterized membrane protein YqjE